MQRPLLEPPAEGGVITVANVGAVADWRDATFLSSLLLRNVRAPGHDAAVGLAMSLLLLADMSLFSLLLLQFYSLSLLALLLVLLLLPFTPVCAAVTGLLALFSNGRKRAAAMGRMYGLWNVTSLSNAVRGK